MTRALYEIQVSEIPRGAEPITIWRRYCHRYQAVRALKIHVYGALDSPYVRDVTGNPRDGYIIHRASSSYPPTERVVLTLIPEPAERGQESVL